MSLGYGNNTTTFHQDALLNVTSIRCGPYGILIEVTFAPMEHGQKINAILLIIVNILSSFIAVVGNGLVLITIRNSTELKGPIYTLTAALCTLDFLVGAFLQPIFVSISGARIFKTTNLCGLYVWGYSILAPVLAKNSLAVLTLIALERFCAVIFPFKYKRIITKFRAALALGFVLSFNFVNDVVFRIAGQVRIYRFITSTVLALNYLIMFISYVSIVIALKTSNGQLANRASIEITKTVALASCLCGLCWLPFILCIPFIRNLNKSSHPNSLVKVIYIGSWTATLYQVNSAANIAVYCYRNTVLRREIKLQAKGILSRFVSVFQRTNVTVTVTVAGGEQGQTPTVS